MAVEFRKLSRNDRNVAVFRDGEHVDALVRLQGSNKWTLWKDDAQFTDSERRAIADELDRRNGEG